MPDLNSTRRIAELMNTPEFRILTGQQQAFLARYIVGGYNAIEACKFAYAGKSTKNAELRAYQLLGNKRLRAVLDLHFRRSAMESLLEDLHIAIKKSLRRDRGLSPDTTKAIEFFEQHAAVEKSRA